MLAMYYQLTVRILAIPQSSWQSLVTRRRDTNFGILFHTRNALKLDTFLGRHGQRAMKSALDP